MSKKIAIIGSGISGISAAAYAAKDGNEVHVFEKNSTAGGRARQFKTDNGYAFDMGPSWYWMPDVIETFFNDFEYCACDFYDLVSLDPQFEMVFSDSTISVPASYEAFRAVCESLEYGASKNLDAFMRSAKSKYALAMQHFAQKPCHSWWEFVSVKIAASALSLDLLSDFRSYVNRYFSHPKLRTLMEFPVIFLGASPRRIPALYSLMNYGGYGMGTWYPMGGFYQLPQAMKKVAEEHSASFHFEHTVEKIVVKNKRVHSVIINGSAHEFDAVIASSDYHHTESLLEPGERNYTEDYWVKRTFAPSCLIYYLGFKETIPRLKHHTLFFENDLDAHIASIYDRKEWPDKPLFYACCPSKTDPGVAPSGHDNVFLLMPLAIGTTDDEHTCEKYFHEMIRRLEKHTGTSDLLSKLDYKKSYCVSDFINDYNAYKGNAYGLANTISQTAVLKPTIRNRQCDNLFYTGQLTVPGPGVPPSIISGKIVAREVSKIKIARHETTV